MNGEERIRRVMEFKVHLARKVCEHISCMFMRTELVTLWGKSNRRRGL